MDRDRYFMLKAVIRPWMTDTKKQGCVVELIHGYGVARMAEIPDSKYEEFLESIAALKIILP